MEELRKQIYERDSEQARDLLKLNSIYMKEVFENYFCSDVLKEFNYIIEISKTALSSKGLPTQIQNTVDTKGESLVKELLSENKGYWILANVDTTKIKIKEKKEKYAKLI